MLEKIKILSKQSPRRIFFLLTNYMLSKPIQLIEKVFSIPIKTLIYTKIGRKLLYITYPKNSFLIASTKEDLNYLLNTSDLVIGKSIFVNRNSFDSDLFVKAANLLKITKDFTLYDVGANIGTIGLFAVSKGFVKKCVSFEPDPLNFRLLKSNIEINDLSEYVVAYNIALSHKSDQILSFEKSKNNFGDHKVVSGFNNSNEFYTRDIINVKSKTLDQYSFLSDLSKSIVFVDAQGFETNILFGSKQFLEKSVPFVLSFCPYSLNKFNNYNDFVDYLIDFPYKYIIDLNSLDGTFSFGRESFLGLHDKIGTGGGHTDILIF